MDGSIRKTVAILVGAVGVAGAIAGILSIPVFQPEVEQFFGRKKKELAVAPVAKAAGLTPAAPDQAKPPAAPMLKGPATSPPEPSTAVSKTGPTLRVFLKNNLGQAELANLRRLLPDYTIEVGRSGIKPNVSADTLFVNRDRVTVAEVLQTLRAMEKAGVPIKTVMQTPVGGRREIQVGTVAVIFTNSPEQAPLFQRTDFLDVDALGRLRGADFWRAAANGYELCLDGGGMVSCHLDAEARPQMASSQ